MAVKDAAAGRSQDLLKGLTGGGLMGLSPWPSEYHHQCIISILSG